MSKCIGCERAARNPCTGVFVMHCEECETRMLAHGQDYWQSEREGSMTSTYRAALEAIFGERWRDGGRRVWEWAERIKAALEHGDGCG